MMSDTRASSMVAEQSCTLVIASRPFSSLRFRVFYNRGSYVERLDAPLGRTMTYALNGIQSATISSRVQSSCFSVRLSAVSPSRPARFGGAARSSRQDWPKATAEGGAKRS
jgi:hypothetical protein